MKGPVRVALVVTPCATVLTAELAERMGVATVPGGFLAIVVGVFVGVAALAVCEMLRRD